MILPPTWQSRQSDDIKQPNLHSCQPAGSVFLLPGRTAQPAGCCPKGPWSKIKLEVSHYTSVSSVPCKNSVSLRFPARILEWFSMLFSSNSSCRLWYFASSVNAVYLSIADSFLMAERVLIPRHLFMWFTNSDMAADGKTNCFSLRYFRYYAADSYSTEPLIYFQRCHLFRIFLIAGFSSFWILKYAIRHLIGDWLSPRYFRYNATDSYSTELPKFILRSHHLDRIFFLQVSAFSGIIIPKQSGQFPPIFQV